MKFLLPLFVLVLALVVSFTRQTSSAVRQTSSPSTLAFIVIDVQNCFTDGGALEVKDGNEVIPVINQIRSDYGEEFDAVVLTQDWHCDDHVSFVSEHPNHQAYDEVNLTYTESGDLCAGKDSGSTYAVNCTGSTEPTVQVTQVLWPDHCVINTTGAEFEANLQTQPSDVIVRKGYHCQIDSYSAFFDNGHITKTELDAILKERGVTTIYLVGLATDYCVYYSAKDGHSLGYKTYVILDATRGIAEDTTKSALADMEQTGILLINSTELPGTFPTSSGRSSLLDNWKSLPSCVLSVLLVRLCQHLGSHS